MRFEIKNGALHITRLWNDTPTYCEYTWFGWTIKRINGLHSLYNAKQKVYCSPFPSVNQWGHVLSKLEAMLPEVGDTVMFYLSATE
jgi:hypothetical protein